MSSINRPKFQANTPSDFYPVLRSRVEAYFTGRKITKYGDYRLLIKAIVLFSGYILPFLAICFYNMPLWAAFFAWLVMGISMSGIGMAVMHDANHGSWSESKSVNKFLGTLTLNMLGASVDVWKQQHNVLHHTYTNVVSHDEDINDKLVLRLSQHTPLKRLHRFQFVYALFLYSITTLYWVTAKDFVQLHRYLKNGSISMKPSEKFWAWARLTALKVIYLTIMLALPVILGGYPFWQVLLGFLLMHFTAGIILTITFQLAHSVEAADFPLPNESGIIENDWAIHQLNTTMNFARHNPFLSWYLGGLNYQVEHHLFPKVSHIHYPALSEIVKNTAQEYNIPYLETQTMREAIGSHLRHLRNLGKVPALGELLD